MVKYLQLSGGRPFHPLQLFSNLKMFASRLNSVSPLLLLLCSLSAAEAAASHRRAPSPAPAVPAKLPGQWTSQGCYTDDTSNRALAGPSQSKDGMTIETCINFCTSNSYVYAGVEYSRECYCGNQLIGSTQAASTDCNMACKGDASELCGGPNRLNLFLNGNTPPAQPSTPSSVGDWNSIGCWTDAAGSRTMPFSPSIAQPMTINKCTDACHAAGYSLSGVEYADECYCGNQFDQGAQQASGCNMACNGDPTQFCGGGNRLNVYEYKSTSAPTVKPGVVGFHGSWSLQGCAIDSVSNRVLVNRVPVNGLFDAISCIEACDHAGFPLAGVEFGSECYCGQSYSHTPQYSDLGDCNSMCAGVANERCGGPNRLQVYLNNQAAAAPVQKSTIGSYTSQGCYTDNVSKRTLTKSMSVTGDMTEELCVNACSTAGYKYAGVEYAGECWCDNSIQNGGASTTTGCDMTCKGDSTQLCGGANHLNVFKRS